MTKPAASSQKLLRSCKHLRGLDAGKQRNFLQVWDKKRRTFFEMLRDFWADLEADKRYQRKQSRLMDGIRLTDFSKAWNLDKESNGRGFVGGRAVIKLC